MRSIAPDSQIYTLSPSANLQQVHRNPPGSVRKHRQLSSKAADIEVEALFSTLDREAEEEEQVLL